MAKKENKNIHEITKKIEGDSWTKAIDEAFKEKVDKEKELIKEELAKKKAAKESL